MTSTSTDCRTNEGVVVGLVDGIIAMARTLRRNYGHLETEAITEALDDLRTDEDIKWLLMHGLTRVPTGAQGLVLAPPKLQKGEALTGTYLRTVRRALDMDFDAFADAVGVTRSSPIRWERAKDAPVMMHPKSMNGILRFLNKRGLIE